MLDVPAFLLSLLFLLDGSNHDHSMHLQGLQVPPGVEIASRKNVRIPWQTNSNLCALFVDGFESGDLSAWSGT